MAVEDDTEVEVTRYSKPGDDDFPLVDDRIEDKTPAFDPSLVDRRPVGRWELNASAAVIRLDVMMAQPDRQPELLELHPSYASIAKTTPEHLLPSINQVDGKAKQFDDGLSAAIDQAWYLGHGKALPGVLPILERLHARVAKPSAADDYLAAGLILGGVAVESSPKAKEAAKRFLDDEVRGKPISFFTWTKTLQDCFRVVRFFSRAIGDESIPVEIARVLREDKGLRDDYVQVSTFHAGMTNPLVGRTPSDLVDGPPIAANEVIRLFPGSSTRENELFEKLFPSGLPREANLMRELVAAIRSGRVDLHPRKLGGWYDYQVAALETLLLPERGVEASKLLLTKPYKKRMLEAFQALMTKRRETQDLKIGAAEPKSQEDIDPMPPLRPRLRVEPNPTFYLRTARSYAFLANFLESTVGDSTLTSLKGLRESGEREMDLAAELTWMRHLFYGLALLSAEDLGTRLPLLEGEGVEVAVCEAVATRWLARITADPDLAADTRVAVPVYYDPRTGHVRIWATVGVRLTRLDVRYARPPSVRPIGDHGDWKPVADHDLRSEFPLIAVDEFAEVEVKNGRVYDRAELRALCDRMKTKAKIIEAMEQ